MSPEEKAKALKEKGYKFKQKYPIEFRDALGKWRGESRVMNFESYNIYTDPNPDTINPMPVPDYVDVDYFDYPYEEDEKEPPNATGRNDRETKNKLKKAVYKQSVA